MKTYPENDFINEQINAVEIMIKSGQHNSALKSIKMLLKNNIAFISSSYKSLITISNQLKRLGDVVGAIKVLGNELDQNQLRNADEGQLIIQLRLAEILNFIGAKYVALRIVDGVLHEGVCRKLHFDERWPELNFYLADMYLSYGDYVKSEKYYQRVIDDVKNNSYTVKLAKVGLADSYEAQGNSVEAVNVVTNLLTKEISAEETILQAICYQARGEYLFKQNDYANAYKDFLQALSIFPNDVKTKDLAYLLKWIGAYHYTVGDSKDHALDFLKRAYEILNIQNAQPMALIEVLYWMEKIDSNSISFTEKIASRNHINFSPMSYLLGKQIAHENTIPLHKWVQTNYHPNNNNSWFIDLDLQDINAINYMSLSSTFELSSVNNDLDCNNNCEYYILDLVSGCIISCHSNYRQTNCELLSELQVMALIAIISTGSMGISKFALIDYVYRSSFFNIESGERRLKELLKRLEKLNCKIIRNKNYYYFDFANNKFTKIILPMNYKSCRVEFLFKKFYTIFSRNDVQAFFNLSPSSAKSLIKNWIDSKNIKIQSSGKNTQYEFIKDL